jgi:hypothetical protein
VGDVFRLLLSRVAFPEESNSSFAIFCPFADSFCESNQDIGESRDEIRKLAIVSFVEARNRIHEFVEQLR